MAVIKEKIDQVFIFANKYPQNPNYGGFYTYFLSTWVH